MDHCRAVARFLERGRVADFLNCSLKRESDVERAISPVSLDDLDSPDILDSSSSSSQVSVIEGPPSISLKDYLRQSVDTLEVQDPSQFDSLLSASLFHTFLSLLLIALHEIQQQRNTGCMFINGNYDGITIMLKDDKFFKLILNQMMLIPIFRYPEWKGSDVYLLIRDFGSIFNDVSEDIIKTRRGTDIKKLSPSDEKKVAILSQCEDNFRILHDQIYEELIFDTLPETSPLKIEHNLVQSAIENFDELLKKPKLPSYDMDTDENFVRKLSTLKDAGDGIFLFLNTQGKKASKHSQKSEHIAVWSFLHLHFPMPVHTIHYCGSTVLLRKKTAI
jgi:hypothetical protein